MSRHLSFPFRWSSLRTISVTVGFGALVVVLLLYLAGRFSSKVPAIDTPAQVSTTTPPIVLATARLVELPLTETAVGSIRAVHETTLAAKLTARVVAVNLKAGQAVRKGELLVQLDDKDLKARLSQAQSALTSAEAQRAQAAVDEEKLRKLVGGGAVSQQEYDKAATALKTSTADAQRYQELINEAQAVLEYATIRAPIDGTVVDKKVDVGDMVMPGQVLLVLYDPKRMQLIASVRESLAQRLKVGQVIGVRVDVLAKTCGGEVSEIVPEAQSASRSFLVKVTGPCPAGIYSGMFGRLLIPMGTEQVLVIPKSAVRKVGQIELVDVSEKGQLQRRAVRTGRVLGDDVEILSGLQAGEQVVQTPGEGA
ncbi:MAG: efflux RND transporter periplasmic adaptor subunit [Phycisphaerae bacterium]